MKYSIKADSAFEACRLEIQDDYCSFRRGAVAVSSTKITYQSIDCLLLSPENILSIHYAGQTFAIRVKPKDDSAVAHLIHRVGACHSGTA